MRLAALLVVLCCTWACSAALPGERVEPIASGSSARIPLHFRERVRDADEIIVGRLVSVDFSAPAEDRFLTTSRWLIEESLKGGLITDAIVTVRLESGRDPETGAWRSLPGEILASSDQAQRMRQHERVLLLLSRATYAKQAAARGGRPHVGRTGAGLGLYRVAEGRLIADGTGGVPATLAEARALIEEEVR